MKNKKAYITDNGLNCKIIKAAEKLDELIKKGMIRSDKKNIMLNRTAFATEKEARDNIVNSLTKQLHHKIMDFNKELADEANLINKLTRNE